MTDLITKIDMLRLYTVTRHYDILSSCGIIYYSCKGCGQMIVSHYQTLFVDDGRFNVDRKIMRENIIDRLRYHYETHEYIPPLLDVK